MGEAVGINLPINIAVSGGVEEDEAGAVIKAGVGHHLVDIRLAHPLGELFPFGIDHAQNRPVRIANDDVGSGRVATLTHAFPRLEAVFAAALRHYLKIGIG